MTVSFPFSTPLNLDNDPEADRLLEQGPVVRARSGENEIWLALSHQAVRATLSDPRFSRELAAAATAETVLQSAATPLALSSMDPPRHNRTRRLMAKAFSPRMIDKLEPRITEITDSLLDRLSSPADLMAAFCVPLPVQVICELLGVPGDVGDRVREWSSTIFAVTYPPERIAATEREAQAYLVELVEAKRTLPDDALISAMVAVNDEGDYLTEEEMLVNLQGLLMAGHETTVNQLGNSLVTLLRHPGQLALLREDPSLVGRAVDELFRFTRISSVTMPRVTTEAVVLDGVEIGPYEVVLPITASANRDPAAYPDPHRLDITREGPAPHVSLGHGPHFCLGAQLAKAELRIALTSLLERFDDLALAVDESELTYHQHLLVRSLTSLPVTFTPRDRR